jgi:uncharacterized protein
MPIEFDSDKDAANIAKHGISLAQAAAFEIAVVIEDDRHDYGERRFRAFGWINAIAYCLVFTLRDEVRFERSACAVPMQRR